MTLPVACTLGAKSKEAVWENAGKSPVGLEVSIEEPTRPTVKVVLCGGTAGTVDRDDELGAVRQGSPLTIASFPAGRALWAVNERNPIAVTIRVDAYEPPQDG